MSYTSRANMKKLKIFEIYILSGWALVYYDNNNYEKSKGPKSNFGESILTEMKLNEMKWIPVMKDVYT